MSTNGAALTCRWLAGSGTAPGSDLASADKERELPGHVRRYTPGSCVISSSKPITSLPVDGKEPRMPTTSKAIATKTRWVEQAETAGDPNGSDRASSLLSVR